MIVPREEKARDEKIKWILDQCLESQAERMSLYDMRRRYFLFGTADGERAIYNRLQAHLDLVCSFLYSADHARFNVAAPRNSNSIIVKQTLALEEEWNDEFRDSGLAYQFAEAVIWSLVFDSMFLKLGWNDAREELFAEMIEPGSIGVYNEAVNDLDSQQAFTHSYLIDWDEAVLRMARAGKRDQIKKLSVTFTEGVGTLPPVLNSMLVSSSAGPSLTGQLKGSVNQNYYTRSTYQPASTNPMVQFHEVWFWDDLAEDYAMVTVVDPDIVISDSRDTLAAYSKATKKKVKYGSKSNVFLPGEHPFVHISPYKVYNYFWGEAHTDRLINLQDWSSGTLDNIREILEMQVDPAKVFSGFMGLTDEKAAALGGPGSWVVDQLPGAKVDRLIPEMPPDLFANFQSIGHIFLEASGLTETVSGKGETGVRGRGHAKQLATTGSGRIRRTAVGLEEPLVKIGDLGIKLLQRNSTTPLKIDAEGDSGMEFLLAQLATNRFKIRIAGHSHSPLFSDESREMAVLLLKARSIDREMFVKMLAPPNEAAIIHKLRENAPKEAAAAQMQMLAKGGAGGKKSGQGAAPTALAA